MGGGHAHDDHGHGHGSTEEEGISMDAFKIIIFFAMFFCCGFGILPKVWPTCNKSETALSLLNCFSAGLFLGMAIIHMFPEAVEIYQAWALEEGIERAFPLPYVGFYLGYLIILAVDRVAIKACNLDHGHQVVPLTDRSMQQQEMKPVSTPSVGDSSVTPADAQVAAAAVEEKVDAEKKEGDAPEATVSKTSAIVLICAIGVHAVFEGIAFGLQTEMENAIQLALGILIHKSAAAVSIGGAFARSGYSTKMCIIFVILFASFTPIGILIGMAVTASNKLLDTIFMSTSGGTFIYVACSEIVINEFDKGKL